MCKWVKNRVRDVGRKLRLEVPCEPEEMEPLAVWRVTPLDEVHDREELERLERLIASMPGRKGEAMRMELEAQVTLGAGADYTEMEKEEGLAAGTGKTYRSKGRRHAAAAIGRSLPKKIAVTGTAPEAPARS